MDESRKESSGQGKSKDYLGAALACASFVGGIALLSTALNEWTSTNQNSYDQNRSRYSYRDWDNLGSSSSSSSSYTNNYRGHIWSSSPSLSSTTEHCTNTQKQTKNVSSTLANEKRTTGSGGSSQHGTRQSLPSTTTSYYNYSGDGQSNSYRGVMPSTSSYSGTATSSRRWVKSSDAEGVWSSPPKPSSSSTGRTTRAKKASEGKETRDPSGSNLQLVKSTAEEERVAPQRKSHTCQHTITGWDYIDTKINQIIDKILDGYTELGEEDHGPMHKLIVDILCNLTELLKSVDWAEKITGLIKALAEKRMMANRNLGNLSPSATSDTLKAYFARYAEIVKACVECNEMTQRSKGYGFVECATFEDAEKVFDCAPHYVDGRRVTVRYARPRGFDMEKARENALRMGYSLNVGSVPACADHQDILRTFSQFGSIVAVKEGSNSGSFEIVFATMEGRRGAWQEGEHRVCDEIVQCSLEGSLDESFDNYLYPVQSGILEVGEILNTTADLDLKKYFSRFGNVKEVERRCRHCYLKMSSWLEVEHVMAFGGTHCCKGNYLTVNRVSRTDASFGQISRFI